MSLNRPTDHGRIAPNRGFTLIEFIIAVIVLAIGSTLLVSIVTPASRSADPLFQAQARAIATAYMDEILQRDTGACTGTNRADWNAVSCYDGLNESPPRDQFNNPITGLSAYSVSLDAGGSAIAVTVNHPAGVNWRLQSLRGDY